MEKCGKDFNMWAHGSQRVSVPTWKYVQYLFGFFGNFLLALTIHYVVMGWIHVSSFQK